MYNFSDLSNKELVERFDKCLDTMSILRKCGDTDAQAQIKIIYDDLQAEILKRETEGQDVYGENEAVKEKIEW